MERDVIWLIRFLGWATVLALPCVLVADSYHRGLAEVVSRLLSLFGLGATLYQVPQYAPSDLFVLGHEGRLSQVEVLAPTDLGFFVAMCMASRRASALTRLRSLAIGIPVLMAIETLTLALYGASATFAGTDGSRVVSLRDGVMATLPWVSAPAVWLALLGPWELPAGRRRRRETVGGPGPEPSAVAS
jgi:hypothetical protein